MSDELISRNAISKSPLRAGDISHRFHTIRGHRVMLEADLAEVYGVPTEELVTNCERFDRSAYRYRVSGTRIEDQIGMGDELKPQHKPLTY